MNKLKVMISLIVFLMLIDTVIAQNGDTLYDFSEGKSVEYGGTTFRGDGFSLDSAGVFSISNGKGTIGEFDSVEGDFSGKATGNGIVEGTVGKNGLKIKRIYKKMRLGKELFKFFLDETAAHSSF